MTHFSIYALVGVGLFSLGFFTLIVHADLLRKILAVNVIGSGVFLILVAMSSRGEQSFPDPLPHAMVITGIVVAVSATALALALILRLRAEHGSDSLS